MDSICESVGCRVQGRRNRARPFVYLLGCSRMLRWFESDEGGTWTWNLETWALEGSPLVHRGLCLQVQPAADREVPVELSEPAGKPLFYEASMS